MTTLQENFEQLGVMYGFEGILELEEILKEHMSLCQIKARLDKRKSELEKFINGLEECKKMKGSMLSPVAGILEQGELDSLNEFLGVKNDS